MATATPVTNVSLRCLQRRPEYYRSTSIASQSSDDKRMTATERLEADKLKYVKSAQARRRRATYDFHGGVTGRNADSTGSHSGGSDSTASPIDDYVTEFAITDDVTDSREDERAKLNRHAKLERSVTEGTTNVRIRTHPKRRPRPKSSTAGCVIFETSFQGEPKQVSHAESNHCQSSFTKDEKARYRRENSEPISTRSIHDSFTADRLRHSTGTRHQPTYSRSASVGTVTPRQSDGPENASHTPSQSTVMSPRSRLRYVRQNLKKVHPIKLDENRSFSNVRLRGKTSNSQRNDLEKASGSNPEFHNPVKLRQHKPQRQRPFSVIENINHFEFGASLFSEKDKHFHKNATSKSTPSNQCTDTREIHTNSSRAGRNETSSTNKTSFKRRSLDLSHAINTSLQLPLQQQALGFPDKQPNINPIEPECKVSSCHPSITTQTNEREYNDSTKLPQNYNKPSLTKALEKILIPTDQNDDMNNADCDMDGLDADSKTLLASSFQNIEEPSKPTFAASINNALCGRTYDSGLGESRNSESPDSQLYIYGDESNQRHHTLPTGKVSKSFSPNLMDFYPRSKNTDWDTTTIPKDRNWVNDNFSRKTSQPFNRIDLAPNSNPPRNGPVQTSPTLAPKSRKEVAPDYRISGNANFSIRAGKDDHSNVLKSQTTISTTSCDNNKPLTAFTASDLKPRRGRKNSVTHSTPLKPTCPYSPNNKMSPKRQSSTPLSPTMSPNRQSSRAGPPHSARSASSTPYSSLRRNPHAARSSSLKRNRQRSKSDVSTFHSELDQFFSNMGMDESLVSPYHSCDCIGNHVSSESDFSFAGASAYVRDGPDEAMEVDPISARLASVPTVSVIEKNARVMRWIMSCKKSLPLSPTHSKSPRHVPSTSCVPPRPIMYNHATHHTYSNCAPALPPRTYHTFIPKESNV